MENVTELVRSLRVLNEIGRSIIAEHSISEIIDTVYGQVNLLMAANSFAIGIYDPKTNRIEFIGARENDKKLPYFFVDAGDETRFSGYVFKHKLPLLIRNYDREWAEYLPAPINPLQGITPKSCLYMPLMIKEAIIGLLAVRTITENAYGQVQLEMLQTLSVFIAQAIENARARSRSAMPGKSLPQAYLLDPLSERELEVLTLLSNGLTNRAIAAAMFISVSTVKTHTINIYRKLIVGNRTEAIATARNYGLLA